MRSPQPLPPEAQMIDAFLRRGGSVCTFATVAANANQIDYCVADLDNAPQAVVYPAVHRLLAEARRGIEGRAYACIVVDAAEPGDAAAHQERAFRLREEIGMAILQSQRVLPIAWGLRSQAKRLLAERPGVMTIPAGDQETVLFAMAPHYPQHHRRYAPRLILPLTLRSDAEAMGMRYPKMMDAIHHTVLERCGELLGAMSFYEENDEAAAP